MEKKKYVFETRLDVRDYECDIQGIVNNANYLHYTEHTRHRFLKSLGVSFSDYVGYSLMTSSGPVMSVFVSMLM